MSPTKGWGHPATALPLPFSLIFPFGCDRKDGAGTAANAAAAPGATRNGSGDGSAPRRLPKVEVLRLVPRDFSRERTYIGHLIPFERVQQRAEIDGLVEPAVMYGLSVATRMTLVVVPALHSLPEGIKEFPGRLLGAGQQGDAAYSEGKGEFTPRPLPAGGGGAANE